MRFTVLVGPLLAAGFSSSVAAVESDARSVAEAFCKARLAQDEKATMALLTPSLVAAIEEAQARSAVIAKTAPDEKPPLGDGIPFQAFPDVPESCEAGEVTEVDGHEEVQISYSFADSPDAGWTDRLQLVPHDRGLLIDDVIYANVANGEPDLGLREVLFDSFDQ
jgi:hypothetical protein